MENFIFCVVQIENSIGFFCQAQILTFILQKICFIYFNESPLKVIKNAFYFIVKAFFVLKIFNFLS